MLDMIRQFAEQLSRIEKIALADDLARMIAREIAGGPGEPSACPHCGCPAFVRRGRDAAGRQRYLCRGCARTFTAASRGLLARSKLDAGRWMEFARCLADEVSLRESAARCGVCLRTAWFMRHRACEVMASRLEPFRPVGEVQVDEKFFAESMTGNHSRPAGRDGAGSFGIPREPHGSGHAVKVRGLSRLQICVVTGVNELGDEFAEVCCRGQAGGTDLEAALRGRVGAGATVKTDGKGQYARALAELGAAHVAVPRARRSADNINVVNAMHSRLGHFMDGFYGVSTKHLQHYLDWFCYKEQFRRSDGDSRERIYRHEAEGRYRTSRRGYVGKPLPFGEYWGLAA